MKRDWNTFFRYSLRALKGSLVGLFLVPIFYFIFNPHYDGDALPGLIISIRIGLEVVVVNLLVTTAVYAAIYQWSIPQMILLKESVKFRFAIGFSGMALGLLAASKLEPTFGGSGMNVQGITTGLTVGGITYLAFILTSLQALHYAPPKGPFRLSDFIGGRECPLTEFIENHRK